MCLSEETVKGSRRLVVRLAYLKRRTRRNAHVTHGIHELCEEYFRLDRGINRQ